MIENESSKVVYTVGSSTVYPFPIRFFEKTDIVVYLNTRRLTPEIDYSVESKEDYSSGASITLKTGGAFSALPIGQRLTIMRQLPYRQMTSFPQYGKFPAKASEIQLDKIVCQIQQLVEMSGANFYDPVTAGQNFAGNQFAVINTSNDDVLKIQVINGNSPGDECCGTLNGVRIEQCEIVLDSNIPQYFVYVAGDKIYALKHKIQSDIVPVLLCATVSVGSNLLYIQQHNFANDPVIKVSHSTSAVQITAEAQYADYTLTFDYTVNASILQNNTPINVTGKLPRSIEGRTSSLAVYVGALTVPVNTKPVTGFTYTGTTEPTVDGYEWSADVLRYRLDDQSFKLLFLSDIIQFFTFTLIPE